MASPGRIASFPSPGTEHGERIFPSIIEQRAQGTNDHWISATRTFPWLQGSFMLATERGGQPRRAWLNESILPGKEFQRFGFGGSKDL
ncbi:AMP-binding enzyme [Penicillium chermesinum]|uniref:AMP-binding enzyme n=1 Tax=Penicillium chermesinum TaxID=63820 RepID=A0A9W9NPD9_9EURO|nr:AMP-binding enzyme [Penicillium chermesinum]KAJ5223541.1 AMP-binding enzyme [Penicillium chermesinum]KAJ6155628.1 AMP-binding enzyme [Penicillium chermesinum]